MAKTILHFIHKLTVTIFLNMKQNNLGMLLLTSPSKNNCLNSMECISQKYNPPSPRCQCVNPKRTSNKTDLLYGDKLSLVAYLRAGYTRPGLQTMEA